MYRRWVGWLCPLMVTLLVAGSCSSGRSFPPSAHTVDIDMREYRFDINAQFTAGRTVVRVRNRGHLQHEMVLIYLAPEVPPINAQLHSSERLVVPTVVSLHPREPGRTGAFAVDLDPGRYALVCFLKDPDGVQHALKGMNAEFRVK